MASSPLSPSYGERPPLSGYRRSFTAPHRALSHHERAGLDNSDADSGVLYKHPSVRIISFAPPVESVKAKSKSAETHRDADYPIDTIETLPWRSRNEDLLAAGEMRIEKVQGSVHFLKCGSVVHSILRNSQCWCVDGESKFVLRKGRLQYYRIELPTETEEDRTKVEELKTALPTVLKFEKTPCPFKRAFHVSLPDDAITPRRKGKWRRKEASLGSALDLDGERRRGKTARSWTMHNPPLNSTPREVFDQLERRRGSDYGLVSRVHHGQELHRPGTPSSVASGESGDSQDYEEEEGSQRDDSPDRPEEESEQVPAEASEDKKSVEVAPEPVVDAPTASEETSAVQHDEITTAGLDDADGFDETEQQLQSPVPSEEKGFVENEATEESLVLEKEELPPSEAQAIPGTIITEPEQPDTPAVIGSPLTANSNEQEVDEADHAEELAQQEVQTETLPTQMSDTEVTAAADTEETELGRQVTSDEIDDTVSIASTIDSFATANSLHQTPSRLSLPTFEDVEATPLAEHRDPLDLNSHRQHKREISELTVTASTFSDSPGTPHLLTSSASDSSWPDIQTPSPPGVSQSQIHNQLRQRLKQHRSLSPLPPSETIFRPPNSPTNHGNHLTAALLQKACNVALVKPIEVVVLVVHVLARIAGGATMRELLSGDLFRRPEGTLGDDGRAGRGHRKNRSSFPDQVAVAGDGEGSAEEDDYGVPLRGRRKSSVVGVVGGGKDSGAEGGNDTDVDSMFDDLD